MSKNVVRALCAATSIYALSAGSGALAAQPPPAAAPASAGEATLGEVIVTARRREENLQNVPVTVSAISGDTIKKLNFTQFQDLSQAVAGLALTQDSTTSGGFPAPTLRGVTYDGSASPSPTVDTYYNEVPISPNIAFNAMYDLSGVQILRGPQGTLRGRTAPSGAITISTHQADPAEIGGYISGLATDHKSTNLQGALNVPVIKDVLAIRLSGLSDENEGNFVNSIHSDVEPHRKTTSGRLGVTFTPTSDFTAHLLYQTFVDKQRSFTQVAGPGAPGGVVATAPANYNGPPITARQRVGVDDFASYNSRQHDLAIADASWLIHGQQLEYVGSFQQERNQGLSANDTGDALLGHTATTTLGSRTKGWTQEIRLSSTGTDNLIDYSVGYFHSDSKVDTTGPLQAAALGGAFGSPLGLPDPSVLNPRYVLDALVNAHVSSRENSFYGNVTLHLDSKTELSAGARKIDNYSNQIVQTFLGGGFIAIPLPIDCAAIGFATTYPGACDIPITAGTTPLVDASQKDRAKPWVYNVSLRRRFTDDILGYASVGTSWRQGTGNITLDNADEDPVLSALNFTGNETSRSFELGLKTTWLDRRLRVNAAVYRQTYKNLIFQIPSIPYVDSNGQTTQVSVVAINVGADAIVTGIDFDAAFQATRNWTMSLAVSYADGHIDDDTVPCRDANFDGVPDAGTPTLADFQAHNAHIALCKSTQSVARTPYWSANIQSEYFHPITDNMDGYVRGLLNYYPKNANADIGYQVPNYTLLNIYAGVRSPAGAWDVGLFARNITNTGVELRKAPGFVSGVLGSDTTFGTSGYGLVSYTPPREVGVSVRYAFGGG